MQIPSNIKLKASLKPQKYQLTPQQEVFDLTALSVRREAEQLYCYLKGERARLQRRKNTNRKETGGTERGSSYQGITEESKGQRVKVCFRLYCSKSRP